MVKDPICGMEVDESRGIKLFWQGKDYFCPLGNSSGNFGEHDFLDIFYLFKKEVK